MKTFITTAALAVALSASAALANDFAVGGGFGSVSSSSTTGGYATSGGFAGFGNKGVSEVTNQQFAGNNSAVMGGMSFTETDTNGGGVDFDGVGVEMGFATNSVSEQGSRTEVLNKGTGTAGFGEGAALSGGDAFGFGNFTFGGSSSW